MNIDADRIDEVVKRVNTRTENFSREMGKVIKPYGMKPLPDEMFLTWFHFNAFVKYPPEPMMTPEGQPVMTSPWIAMLEYVEGGKEVLRRYAKLTQGVM